MFHEQKIFFSLQPGNEEYLSYYKKQDEWKSTVAKRPIAAMSGSPGPAIVRLPSSIGNAILTFFFLVSENIIILCKLKKFGENS